MPLTMLSPIQQHGKCFNFSKAQNSLGLELNLITITVVYDNENPYKIGGPLIKSLAQELIKIHILYITLKVLI